MGGKMNIDDIKNNPDVRKSFAHFVKMLGNCFYCSSKCYQMATGHLESQEDRAILWEAFRNDFHKSVVQDIYDILGANECGLGETCLAALMLLETVGEKVEQKETSDAKHDFWKKKFAQ
jgi:hypothetical protein